MTLRSWAFALVCATVLSPRIVAADLVAARGSTLNVLDGAGRDEQAAELWAEMIRRLRNDTHATVPARDPTASERAWSSLIVSRLERWQAETSGLARVFAPAVPPASVRVVIGNGGGEDAFTHDPVTIGFDAARLHAEYGEATKPENTARIDRFFRHEYTHLLQKAWLVDHPYVADTPLRTALLGIWKEGLGNYHSLSTRWRDSSGRLTPLARQTLAELSPRLLARLASLACATPESGPVLMRNLSMGPFHQKWGALPIALWLVEDEGRSADAVRAFVLAGPDGVWTLISRSLPEESRPLLAEIRANAARCSAR
jgi:hypothetical protein